MANDGQFQKGQSGNPGGRPRDKPWSDALRIALNETDPATGKRKLRLLAEALIEKGIGGDVAAAREIGDRVEGKAIQPITGEGDDGALVVKIVRLAAESQ